MSDLEQYTAHLAASIETEGLDGLAAASDHLKIGDAQKARGDYAPALESYEAALKIRREILDEEALKVANARHCVGVVQFLSSLPERLGGDGLASTATDGASETDYMDTLESAIGHLEAALRVRCRKLGTGHVDVADTAHHLGLALSHAGGRNDEALGMLHLALRVRSAVLGPDDSLVAETLEGLGDAYIRAGNHRRAIQAHAYALQVREAANGEDTAEAAEAHMALGRAYAAACDHDTALKRTVKALAILKTTYGPNDPKTAKGWLRVGLCHYCRGDVRSAVKSTLEAVRILSFVEPDGGTASLREACAVLASVRWEMQEYELAILAVQVLASGVADPADYADHIGATPGKEAAGSMDWPNAAQIQQWGALLLRHLHEFQQRFEDAGERWVEVDGQLRRLRGILTGNRYASYLT